MSINVARYGLITNEYRYKEAYDSTIDTRYSKARELEIPTHLDLALITSLVTAMFAVVSPVRRRFMVEINDTASFSIDSFMDGTPARYLNAPEIGAVNIPCIVTRAAIDEAENKTTLELWG